MEICIKRKFQTVEVFSHFYSVRVTTAEFAFLVRRLSLAHFFILGGIMKTCCFIGHRNAKETPTLLEDLSNAVIDLIQNKEVTTFLFGSKRK